MRNYKLSVTDWVTVCWISASSMHNKPFHTQSPARDIFGPLALGRYLYPGQRPRWGWEVSRLRAQSSGTVHQPLCELQLSPFWRSLDIWRPTCLADRQRIWGLFMTRSTNPLIIIIIIHLCACTFVCPQYIYIGYVTSQQSVVTIWCLCCGATQHIVWSYVVKICHVI